MHYGSGSVIPSRSAGFTNTGSPRPARPGQLDQMMADNIAGGADPAQINEMSHASAAALLDRVHHTQDAELVERVLTLVDREGVDVIAELWSRSEPDRCRAFYGDCMCCARGCGRIVSRSHDCGASENRSQLPLRQLPESIRHPRKMTLHTPPIRFWRRIHRRFRDCVGTCGGVHRRGCVGIAH